MKVDIKNIDLMIVDAEYLAYRGYHAFLKTFNGTPLQTSAGVESGVFFGFLSLFHRKLREYGPKEVYICWGDKRSNLFRKQISEKYKASRPETPVAFLSQCDDLKLCLKLLGFKQFLSPNYEADDVIGALACKCGGLKEVKIISGDKDLTQLVTENVHTVSLAAGVVKHDTEYDIDKVKEKFGVPPELISDYLTLLGDTADGVEGISGIGEKTAAKLLNENGPIGSWINKIPSITASEKIKQKLLASRGNLVINKRLVSLNQTKGIEIFPLIVPESSVDVTAQSLFNFYEIRKFTPDMFKSSEE